MNRPGRAVALLAPLLLLLGVVTGVLATGQAVASPAQTGKTVGQIEVPVRRVTARERPVLRRTATAAAAVPASTVPAPALLTAGTPPLPLPALAAVVPGTEHVLHTALLLGRLPRPPDGPAPLRVLGALRGRAPPESTGP